MARNPAEAMSAELRGIIITSLLMVAISGTLRLLGIYPGLATSFIYLLMALLGFDMLQMGESVDPFTLAKQAVRIFIDVASLLMCIFLSLILIGTTNFSMVGSGGPAAEESYKGKNNGFIHHGVSNWLHSLFAIGIWRLVINFVLIIPAFGNLIGGGNAGGGGGA